MRGERERMRGSKLGAPYVSNGPLSKYICHIVEPDLIATV